ncbi:MAG TPA: cell wall-binding repeat-containing protein, partial [Chloroflexota bacterium]|nr:cell wall-binding repeat-containing protein [Chloroflexota bacterium]
MKRYLPVTLGLLAFLGMLSALLVPFFVAPAQAQPPQAPPLSVNQLVTGNTYRVSGNNSYETAVAIAQMVYPANREADQPTAVILIRPDDEASLFASVPMIHHPIDAPMLFVDRDRLPPETAAALERFKPHGNAFDRKATAYAMGPIDDSVVRDVEKLGYSVRRIRGATDSPADLARAVDDYRAETHALHPPTVVVASLDGLDYAMPALSFIAHIPTGYVYVTRDTIPD